jgi:hypothetical protein
MPKKNVGLRCVVRAAVLLSLLTNAQRILAQSSSASEPEQSGPYSLLLIRNVTVIDGSGAPAFGPADVFVKGNRIVRGFNRREHPRRREG